MSTPHFDLAVVGAGILGLATARELAQRHPGWSVVVLEKEADVAAHQTGHNSGVIHSGVYYAPGSLKARLCRQGMKDLYAYCEAKGIPTEACGKVVVAVDESELGRLEELHRRSVANGVDGVRLIDAAELRDLEPHCVGVRALVSPGAGIVDYRQVASAYADDVRAAGGEIRTGAAVGGIRRDGPAAVLITSAGDFRAARVVACAGLHSDRLARLSGGGREPRIVPFRGDYWVLRPERRHLCRNLIYPVPDPGFPFLGVHLTRRIEDGSIWLGPNAVLAFAREGYRRRTFRPRDLGQALAARGFRRLARKHWRTGAAEMWRDLSKRAFVREVQRFVPAVTAADVLPGPSGVRAQAVSPDGTLVDDFVIETTADGVVHVRNAPSPGATSSLAIARHIADKVDAGRA